MTRPPAPGPDRPPPSRGARPSPTDDASHDTRPGATQDASQDTRARVTQDASHGVRPDLRHAAPHDARPDADPLSGPYPVPDPRRAVPSLWRNPRLILPLAILAVAAVGAILLADRLSFDALRDNREALIAFRDANYLATVAVFVAAYVAIVALSLPGALLATLTGGFLFGLFPGVLFNAVAATLGAVAIFLAVRWGLGARLAARMEASDGKLRELRHALDANAFSALLTLRLIPVVPFFVSNIVPALVGMRLAPFVAATFIGIIPGGLVYTWVGAGLGEVFARGETPDLGLLFEPHVLGPLLGLAALAALPMVVRLWRRSG